MKTKTDPSQYVYCEKCRAEKKWPDGEAVFATCMICGRMGYVWSRLRTSLPTLSVPPMPRMGDTYDKFLKGGKQ